LEKNSQQLSITVSFTPGAKRIKSCSMWLASNSSWGFNNNEIFYVTGRHQSKVVVLDHLISSPKSSLEGVDFLMWDLSFEAVVEFHHIGIAQKGFRNSSS